MLGDDVKKRGNAEKRPLARFTGVDVEGCDLPNAQGFQPSEQKWMNQWMVDDAMPHLLDKDALSMTEIMVSDEDVQHYGSIDRHLKAPETSTAKWNIVFASGTR